MNIDWKLISRIIGFHSQEFEYVEVPWIVDDVRAINETLPTGHSPLRVENSQIDGYLVGSAEQSFIRLMLNNDIVPGKYMAATPCFRDDPVDELHQRHFFKVELIEILHDDLFKSQKLDDMVAVALAGFNSLNNSRNWKNLRVVETHSGTDIELNGTEVGSYGYRSIELPDVPRHWIYGTALAEPRFSYASKTG